MQPDPIITVKEARKLLGTEFKQFSDDEIERLIVLLESIARETIRSSVPKHLN